MKVEFLEEFLMLAETKSYAVTAENMFISSSSLSRHIALLEEELGTELFTRGPRSVSLNKSGELLLPYAKTIVESKNEYMEVLKQKSENKKEQLCIGFTHSAIEYGIFDAILEFKEENPDISVIMSENNRFSLSDTLKSNEFSFIICFKYIFFDGADIQYMPLFKDELCVILREDHPLAGKAALSLQDIKDEHFILRSKDGPATKYTKQLMKDAGFRPKKMTYVETGRFILQLVSMGIGISVLEKQRFKELLPAGVKMIDLDEKTERLLALIYKSRTPNETETRFMRYMTEKYATSS